MPEGIREMHVSPDTDHNRRLDDNQRFKNIEMDITCQSRVLTELVRQNGRYTEYIDNKISDQKESHEFWMDVKKKLATAGILSTIALVGTVIFYAIKEWIKHQG